MQSVKMGHACVIMVTKEMDLAAQVGVKGRRLRGACEANRSFSELRIFMAPSRPLSKPLVLQPCG